MLTLPKIVQKKLAQNNHSEDSLKNWKHYPICPTSEDKATGNDLAVDDLGTWNLASTVDLIVVVFFILCQSLTVGHKCICCSSKKSLWLPLCHGATSNYNILDNTYNHHSEIILHCRWKLNENRSQHHFQSLEVGGFI